jgi:UDP-glucose 4-epimerase
MNILVTGGAGYVGSIVVEQLINEGYRVVVIDNLQQGHRSAVLPGVELIIADICDAEALDSAFARHNFDAVMHMAADTIVEYSITAPARYFQNNVAGGINLLSAMLKHHINGLIFSSSAAVYGEPRIVPVDEEHPQNPINSYGESKLMFERILGWYGKAYGINHISLRYFCAAGATELLGEDHHPETHLIPNVLKVALHKNSPVSIFGTDYPTSDGTCVRDFVHVIDIAKAHILAMEKLERLSGRIYNLGNSQGYSVMEVVKTVGQVTGGKIPVKVCPRRTGDPSVLVASSNRAKEELGWKPRFHQLQAIVESAWSWLREHPNGYEQ